MTSQRLGIRILTVVSVLCAASWGLGEDEGRTAGGVRPLGVVGVAGDTQAGLLTIHGHHLLPVEGEVVVKLAGQVLEMVSATAEAIQALLPAGLPPGTYLLEVLAGPEASWAAPLTLGEVTDGASPEPVEGSLLRVREAHADLVAGTLLLRGESLGTSPDTTPTVTLSDVPLVVLSANEVEVLARLPGGLHRVEFTAGGGGTSVPASSTLEPGTYRVRVVRTAAGGTASIWTDAMDVTTVSGGGTGDITAVNTPGGGGLQGGVASGDATLGLVGCYAGQVLKSDGSLWSCAEDTDTGVNEVVGGGGVTGSILWRTLTLGSTATPTNTAGAIVARDVTGSFAAGSIGLGGNIDMPDTTSASVGVLTKGGTPFLHNYGPRNTFVGSGAGNFSLTGSVNSAFGENALTANTTGYANSAFGYGAVTANTTGYANSAFGYGALYSNTTGTSNSAFGYRAVMANTIGYANSAFGYEALQANTTGSYNSAFGDHALMANTTGEVNSAFGWGALLANTDGAYNSAFGSWALFANTDGAYNSAFGYEALQANTTGSYNVALGRFALRSLVSGVGNVAIGPSAGYLLTSGDWNIYIGNQLGVTIGSQSGITESRTTRIGDPATTATYISGIWGQTSSSGMAVYVNSSGKLGTTTSSRRYKGQIVDMDAESDVLLKLRPVSFYYRPELDETRLRQYGLVAEEVAEVAPDLVAYDEDGAPQAVRYHFVNAMLLNEMQKQRRQLEAQQAEILELRASVARLEARLPQQH